MEEALRARLLAMAVLTGLVGSRVAWGGRPQGGPLPAGALHLIDGISQINLAAPADWRSERVQTDCLARTHKAARDIADIIGAKATDGGLHGLRDDFGGIRARIFVIARAGDSDTDTGGVMVHRARLDLNIWWKL